MRSLSLFASVISYLTFPSFGASIVTLPFSGYPLFFFFLTIRLSFDD